MMWHSHDRLNVENAYDYGFSKSMMLGKDVRVGLVQTRTWVVGNVRTKM